MFSQININPNQSGQKSSHTCVQHLNEENVNLYLGTHSHMYSLSYRSRWGDLNGMERAPNKFPLLNLILKPMIFVSWILTIRLVPIIDQFILFYLFWEKHIGDSTFYIHANSTCTRQMGRQCALICPGRPMI